MAGTIDAKLRITADLQQAISSLQQLAAKLGQVDAAAASAGASAAVPTAEAGAAAAKTTAQLDAQAKAYDTIGREVAELAAQMKALKAAQDAAAKAPAPAELGGRGVPGRPAGVRPVNLPKVKKEADAAAASVGMLRHQSQQLQMQMTDIVVSLSTGQSPFYVLLQQGGQLRDLYGGVGSAIRAVASQFTLARVAAGGLLAVVGSVVAGITQGALEQDAWNKSIARTGDAAGVTLAELGRQADEIARTQQVTIGFVRDAMTQAAGTGRFVGATLASAGRAAAALSKVTSASAEELIGEFEAMGDGVAAWALKQNKAYNFLTAAEYRHIRSLEAEGRQQEAMRLVLDKLAGTIEERAVPALGWLERGWQAVKNGASGAWEAIKAIGRDRTLEERLQTVQTALADIEQTRERLRLANASKPARDLLEAQAVQLKIDEESIRRELAREAERRSMRALSRQEENGEIRRSMQEYQDALAQLSAAGAEKLLAQRRAALDREQEAVDQAHARGLTSEEQHAQALSRIELKRAQAQEAALQRQLDIERRRVSLALKGDSAESKQAAARVRTLETQLLEAQSRTAAAVAAGRADAEARELERSRAAAQEWQGVWQDAYNRVRDLARANEATRAAAIADPVQRAKAEAEAAVAELRQQIQDAQRDLQLRISLTSDAGMRAQLQQQLDALTGESEAAIGEKLRRGMLDSFTTQYAETMQALQTALAEISELEESNAITTLESERRKNEARAAALPILDELIKRQRELAKTPGERNDVSGKAVETQQITRTIDEVNTRLRAATVGGVGSFLTDVTTKSKTALEAFQDFAGGIARSALDLVGKRFGEQIADSLFPRGGGSSGGGGFLNAIGSFFASVFHSGGIVGAPGGTGRMVPASAFMLAPRFHGGGIIGADERPLIGKVGEEVLREDNPRHIKNFSRNFGGAQVGISVTVNGARGTEAQQSAAGTDLANSLAADLAPFVDERIERWTTRESRAGGVLDPRRRS